MKHNISGTREQNQARARPWGGKKQIRSKEELRTGMKVRLVHNGNPRTVMIITRIPYKDKETGEWVFDYREGRIEAKFPLTEAGLIPYPDGNWHAYNWIERTE